MCVYVCTYAQSTRGVEGGKERSIGSTAPVPACLTLRGYVGVHYTLARRAPFDLREILILPGASARLFGAAMRSSSSFWKEIFARVFGVRWIVGQVSVYRGNGFVMEEKS